MTTARVTRIGLVVLGVNALLPGAWATASPRGFYDDFPGFGATWISDDGPFNEHLLRDFGALNLALAVLALLAALWATQHLVIATAIAFLVYGVPHLTYHVAHGAEGGFGEQLALYGGLAVGPVVAAAILAVAARTGGSDAAGAG